MKLKIYNWRSPLRIFIQEDNKEAQQKIAKDLNGDFHQITFFSKSDSVFDLLAFNPDILFTDYKKNKTIKTSEWIGPY